MRVPCPGLAWRAGTAGKYRTLTPRPGRPTGNSSLWAEEESSGNNANARYALSGVIWRARDGSALHTLIGGEIITIVTQ